MSGEAWLSQRQAQLLEELSDATAGAGTGASRSSGRPEPSEARPLEPDDGEQEAFYRSWRLLKARHRHKEEAQKRLRWKWIEQMQDICGSTCSELEGLLQLLAALDGQRQDVVRKTTALHEQCEQMVRDQESLATSAEAIAERLDLFDRVADVARILDQGTAATSHPEFINALDQLDGSIAFLETHHDFVQAQAYLHQFEHLRNRACISVRSALQRSLEKSAAQVEQQLRERTVNTGKDGALDIQVYYTRFKAAGLNYKPIMVQLHKRIDLHENYCVTLEELEGFYAHLRLRLISAPVTQHLQTILHKELEMEELAPMTRQANAYIEDVVHFERQCFEAYFELRQPQEALRMMLDTIADIFYKALRPVVLSSASIDSLREMADCLQMDILDPKQQSASASDLVPVLAAVFRLHKDVQEKLIFRTQMYIREEIKGYKVADRDLDYPSLLFADTDGTGTNEAGEVEEFSVFQLGWFPTLKRTLGILAKIFRVLEMSTFQGLAQEAVDICITSLKQAAGSLAHRPLHTTVRGSPQAALGQLVQVLDCQLFLIKHLLILREQVATFECDLVSNERYFDFSGVWDALHLRLPDGLLGILKPKMHQAKVDTKKDIEAELKASCETLITHLTAHITQPLAVLNSEISKYLDSRGADRVKLKDQPFMAPDRLRESIRLFVRNVEDRVPFVAAHIRLYLTSHSSAGSGTAGAGDRHHPDTSQSTASILFNPVQVRLLDTWGRLGGLFQEWSWESHQLDDLGFVRPDVLRERVSSLFTTVMEAPWPHLVEVVGQVPRSSSSSSSGARGPGSPPSTPLGGTSVPSVDVAVVAGSDMALPSAGADTGATSASATATMADSSHSEVGAVAAAEASAGGASEAAGTAAVAGVAAAAGATAAAVPVSEGQPVGGLDPAAG